MLTKTKPSAKNKIKGFHLGLGTVILGFFLASVIYAHAQPTSGVIPGSDADPLITQSYVDRAFAPLEKRVTQLETRLNQLPPPAPANPPNSPVTAPVIIKVNQQTINFPDQKPFINPDTDRTLVPIRFVMEAVGAEAEWIPAEKKAVLRLDNTEIYLWINKKEAQVNGVLRYTDQPAIIVNDRTMVPLRFFSENLGYEVKWDAETRTAYIET